MADIAVEEGMGVTTPPIKDVMIVPHHDLGYASQCI